MNPHLREIQNMINQTPIKPLNGFNPVRYLGTNHTFLGIITNNKKLMAKHFHASHPDLTFEELIRLLDALNEGETFEEKTMGPFILERYKKYKLYIIPAHLKKWLTSLQGWCEVDTLCQNFFDGKELLAHFELWENTLKQFSQNSNINIRRASLVLLCKPLRTSNDERLSELALHNINTLKHEKAVLITKAISWVLRIMTKNHRKKVSIYLDLNHKTLPSIAVRETRKKLLTGKK